MRKTKQFGQKESGYNVKFAHNSTQKGGVAILHTKNVECKELYKDKEGRILICEIKYRDKVWLLINVYAPNEDNQDFYIKIVKFIEKSDIMMMGDFNLVINPEIDRIDKRNY